MSLKLKVVTELLPAAVALLICAARRRLLLLGKRDRLARAEANGALHLLAQALRWVLLQHVAALVVAQLKHLRRGGLTAAVPLTQVVVDGDFHGVPRCLPPGRRCGVLRVYGGA